MSIPKDLTNLVVAQSKEISRKKGLPEFDRNFSALELCGEVGEFANVIKKLWRDGLSPEQLANATEELGDVQILVDRIAEGMNIDLTAAIVAKLKKNRIRFKLDE